MAPILVRAAEQSPYTHFTLFKRSLSGGAIAGITVGTIVGICLILFIAFCLMLFYAWVWSDDEGVRRRALSRLEKRLEDSRWDASTQRVKFREAQGRWSKRYRPSDEREPVARAEKAMERAAIAEAKAKIEHDLWVELKVAKEDLQQARKDQKINYITPGGWIEAAAQRRADREVFAAIKERSSAGQEQKLQLVRAEVKDFAGWEEGAEGQKPVLDGT
ncbi:hypothetical protein FH972_021112 [Carpinus fangiana]|uniref:Uncharacterized protein n=1 Tax=Carpinus fangiana TaxID=176857 RepID=A0A5N6KNS5_9ROSI|nr:hypothetical protein FH972_021112 [Carpinus fangiana]